MEIMRSHADATSDAAIAAKMSSDALINSERAWIDGEISRFVNLVVRHRLKIVNHGRTPVQIVSYEIRFGPLVEGTEFSPERLSNSSVRNLHAFLGSGKEQNLEDFDLDDLFAEQRDISESVGKGAFYVAIKYADVIAGSPGRRLLRETSFVYHYDALVSAIERISWFNKYT